MTALTTEVEVALVRSRVYHDFSLVFHYPHTETWELLRSGRFIQDLKRWKALMVDVPSSAYALELGALDMLENVEQLQQEYQRVFGHTMSEEYPLYETQYNPAHIFMQTQELADISGFYKAFGLSVSEHARERADHLSVELEFMSFLAYKEAYARTHHTEREVETCHYAQARFLEDHLGRWIPLFVSRFVSKTPPGVYPELAELLNPFVKAESRYLNVTPSPLRNVDTLPIPEPEGSSPCDECQSADSCTFTSQEILEEGKR